MADDDWTPLDHPLEIYSRFDARESALLHGFVSDVEAITESAFFRNPGGSLQIKFAGNEPLTTQLEYAGEEAVRAVVGLFRQLYDHKEPTSFTSMYKILAANVRRRESLLQRDALDALRDLRDEEKARLRRTQGVTLVVNGVELTPRVLIDLFLHGRYLHKGNEKSARLDRIPMGQIPQSEFHGVMTSLVALYWEMRNVVARVLDHPNELLTHAHAQPRNLGE